MQCKKDFDDFFPFVFPAFARRLCSRCRRHDNNHNDDDDDNGGVQLSVVACKLARGRITPIADAIATSEGLEEVDLSWNPIRRWARGRGTNNQYCGLPVSPKLDAHNLRCESFIS